MAHVAVLVTDGFEDSELRLPVERLTEAGHTITVVGTQFGRVIEGKEHEYRATVERAASSVSVDEFDALLIPGGHSPDALRTDPDAVQLVRAFAVSGKPVAAICHGPQLLIEAQVVAGRRMTSWPSVRLDLINAGADWVDADVVVDGSFVTSRMPADLGAFSDAFLAQL